MELGKDAVVFNLLIIIPDVEDLVNVSGFDLTQQLANRSIISNLVFAFAHFD